MAVEQLPGRVGDFTRYLTALLTRLDQGAGWCGVFWQRDPEGMRACLDGREIPPWDVVEALLQDLAGRYGAAAAEAETEPARALHAAALAAYDSLPGARDALRDRLDVMLREQRYAAERETRLTRTLSHPGTTPETAASLRLDLAWAHDDHTRATARCTELRSRLTALDAVRRGSGGIREDGAPPTPATGPTRPGPPGAEASAHTAGPETPASALDTSAPGGVSGGPGGVGPAHRLAPAAEPGESASASGTSAHGSVSGRPGEDAVARRPAAIDDSGFGVPAPGGGVSGGPGVGPAPAAPPEAPASAFGGPASGGASRMPVDGTPLYRAPGSEDSASAFGAPAQRSAPTEPREGPAFAFDASASDRVPRGPGGVSRTSTDGAPGYGSAPPEDFGRRPAAPAIPPQNPAPTPAASPPPTPEQRKRRRGGARFAGGVDADVSPVVPGQGPVPVVPGRRTPRGARFAGAAEVGEQPVSRAEVPGEGDRVAVDAVVEGVARLRAGGMSGEAHALLAEAALGPATRFPLLAARLERAGLGADWTTLLWETASLPAGPLVAAADALALAGRAADAEQVLRQGVVRPAAEIGEAVAGLVAEGRHREARALLDACVRSRTPEDAARSAAPAPETLVPLLLEAAHDVSRERHWDLVHALRVAGFTA
ncbi:hypothetical protein ABVB69_06220 [Streptomyces sp. NPDC000349]|uniref:hypothetical protein n=1 Tax=unclassified Streptomyces TaxID=2593676 RepID=UPI00277FE21D|nr:hypothetical protein [Streptomyces sp. DSM 40167]MDQ0407279.1 hypothetical protein [Streptomyces sp. DSM 40167]